MRFFHFYDDYEALMAVLNADEDKQYCNHKLHFNDKLMMQSCRNFFPKNARMNAL